MKYIIEIPDDRVCDYVGSTHLLMPYTMAGHKGHHDTGLNLTPYTEPDKNVKNNDVHLCNSCVYNFPDCPALEKNVLYGDGEGFDNVCCCSCYIPKNYYEPESKDRKSIEDEVWETVRKIFTDGTLSGDEDTDPVPFYDCFGEYYFHEVLRKMSYQEAKAKYEAWKKEKDKIRVGDEIIYDSKIGVLLATETQSNYARIFIPHFPYTYAVTHEELLKTGRHFDEVEELLKKMKE